MSNPYVVVIVSCSLFVAACMTNRAVYKKQFDRAAISIQHRLVRDTQTQANTSASIALRGQQEFCKLILGCMTVVNNHL